MQTSRRSILSAGLAGGVSAAALAPLAPALVPASAAPNPDRRPTAAARPAAGRPVHPRRRLGRSGARRLRHLDPAGAVAARRRRSGRHAVPPVSRRVAGGRGRAVPPDPAQSAWCWPAPSPPTRSTSRCTACAPDASTTTGSRSSAGPRRSVAAVTTPSYGATVASLAMAFTSCSNFPAGFFTAYRHLAEERPDLILHLGDYQYEGPAGTSPIGRAHVGPETVTLANYRQRQAQYKSDLDLQAAHAAAPWLPIWDDHEVDNNYAGDIPERAADAPDVPRAPGRGVPGLLREHAAAPDLGPERTRHAALPAGPVGVARDLPHARHPAVPGRPVLRGRVRRLPGRRRPGPVAARRRAGGVAGRRLPHAQGPRGT